jgi:hypothetical protein
MQELIADISDLKRQIALCQPQLNTKGFGTKMRHLKRKDGSQSTTWADDVVSVLSGQSGKETGSFSSRHN